MITDPINALPPHLRDVLTRELDPGEELRWCGQPDPRRERLRVLPSFIGLSVGLLLFGSLIGSIAISIARELKGMEPLIAPSQSPSWGSVWIAGAFAVTLMFAGVLAGIVGPLHQASMARRTIHALTPTRIVTIRLSRRGVPSVEAIEPGHPLHIRRRMLASGPGGGLGDVLIYPRSHDSGSLGSKAQLALYGITDAREVERLIRVTFDPPGTGPRP